MPSNSNWEKTLKLILKEHQAFHPKDEEGRALIEKTFWLSQKYHEGQKRASGQPYFIHPAKVGLMAAKIGMQAHEISGALAHDLIEESPITYAGLKRKIGKKAAQIAWLATVHPSQAPSEKQAYQKLYEKLYSSGNFGAAMVKALDNLHNIKTIKYLPEKTAIDVLQRTMAFVLPFALHASKDLQEKFLPHINRELKRLKIPPTQSRKALSAAQQFQFFKKITVRPLSYRRL